ncbi:MAG: transporter [Planctomycetaceae bacterium]|nr:transporter [Planctomycetaceae bacterium]
MFRPLLAGFVTFLALSSSAAMAQTPGEFVESGSVNEEEGDEGDEIETDRDSFTPSSTLAGRRRLIVESAYSFIDNRRVLETHSLPELLARFGVSELVEFRIGTNYEVGGAGNPISANIPDELAEETGLEHAANVTYGLKFALTEQFAWQPRSALVMQGFTPTSGPDKRSHFMATYVSGWKFENDWTWDSALRYSTGSSEHDHFNIWSPSTVLKIPFRERWKAHLEYFGVFSDGRAVESTQHFISPGAHFLMTRDWELGIRFGWGLNDQSPRFFANIGGGYRF